MDKDGGGKDREGEDFVRREREGRERQRERDLTTSSTSPSWG